MLKPPFPPITWTDGAIDHIGGHGVTTTEVEDVLYSRPRFVDDGRDETALVYGQTTAGRYLIVVVAEAMDGGAYIVTAREMARPRGVRSAGKDAEAMDKAKIEELRDYYDGTDMSESIEAARPDDTVVAEPMVGITVRFPKPVLDRIRALADARGVRVTALIRDVVEHSIAADADPDLVISVADIKRLIAERSHPAA